MPVTVAGSLCVTAFEMMQSDTIVQLSISLRNPCSTTSLWVINRMDVLYPLIDCYLQMYNSKGITTNILLIGNILLPPKQICASPFLTEAIHCRGTCV